MSDEIQTRIQNMVDEHRVILFMKGNPDLPQCGFSSVVANILKESGVPFAAFDVLSDPAIREGIKVFGQWPTIPQLYVDAELVGGCDIIRSLHENGEIQGVLRGDAEG
jgi:monothiol glutaredoxin